MGVWEEYYLPVIGMVSLEFIYATMILMNRVALVKGLSPRIFVFYRQACAALFTSPIAYLSSMRRASKQAARDTAALGSSLEARRAATREETSNGRMDFGLFLLIFITSFVGIALFQNLYIEGLYLASSSVTSAMFNLVPAVTFLMAAILGLEQANVKRLSDVAKVLGTSLCVGGAIAITFLRGQKLLNAQLLLGTHNWLVGCLLLLASVFCWSSWLILQVPITKRYPDYLSLSAWMCFFSTLQTGIMALCLEWDPNAWALSSGLEVGACLFSGIFGSGAQYFIQCWCISRKGPLFTAAFSPLSTVITTFFASMFFHEEVYIGTLLGAIIVIIGLYVFLWGQAEEMKEKKEHEPLIIPTLDNTSCATNIEQPLLTDNSTP